MEVKVRRRRGKISSEEKFGKSRWLIVFLHDALPILKQSSNNTSWCINLQRHGTNTWNKHFVADGEPSEPRRYLRLDAEPCVLHNFPSRKSRRTMTTEQITQKRRRVWNGSEGTPTTGQNFQ